MKQSETPYNLVHIITGAEYKAPLLASQVFDRAQVQAQTQGADRPHSVSVWIIVPMRERYDKTCISIIEKLKVRCPDISIMFVGGIGRLNNWPLLAKMKKLRQQLKYRTVYHCRGEASFIWANKVKAAFPDDATVLDIRGYWPLERYVNDGIFDEKDMSPEQKAVFRKDYELLKSSIDNSDAVCTVSEPLRQYLIDNVGAPSDTALIPCCVKNTIPESQRKQIRDELDLNGKYAILYLGGTQKYQHVEDLVMPFMKAAMRLSGNVVAVLLTQNKDKMAEIVKKNDIDESRIRLMSVAQNEVANYLTAMDAGLLLRAPNALNNFSQPVKFGEYLSAGLPVVLEKGTGSIAEILRKYGIGCVVALSGKNSETEIDNEVRSALHWIDTNKTNVRKNTIDFVENHYTWAANLNIERQMYIGALKKTIEKTAGNEKICTDRSRGIYSAATFKSNKGNK